MKMNMINITQKVVPMTPLALAAVTMLNGDSVVNHGDSVVNHGDSVVNHGRDANPKHADSEIDKYNAIAAYVINSIESTQHGLADRRSLGFDCDIRWEVNSNGINKASTTTIITEHITVKGIPPDERPKLANIHSIKGSPEKMCLVYERGGVRQETCFDQGTGLEDVRFFQATYPHPVFNDGNEINVPVSFTNRTDGEFHPPTQIEPDLGKRKFTRLPVTDAGYVTTSETLEDVWSAIKNLIKTDTSGICAR